MVIKKLTALKVVEYLRWLFIGSPIVLSHYFDIIEKELKALEIIKENANFLCVDCDEEKDKYYIYDAEYYMRNEITKEKYDILIEVLGNRMVK